MPARYRSNVPVRLSVSWERLPLNDRVWILQVSKLPIGAHSVPFKNFTPRDLQQLVAGMRAIVSLADECRFALGYARAAKPEVKENPSETEEKRE
jgi:hypothetical protein